MDGRYAADLPTGEYQLIVSKGPEFEVLAREFVIDGGKTETVAVTLDRWVNMPATGWYSGDDHVHMIRDESDNDSISRIMPLSIDGTPMMATFSWALVSRFPEPIIS